MVKIYKGSMPVAYTYSSAGSYSIKIVGNLSSAAFSSNASDNGMQYMLTAVKKIDGRVEVLDDYAFYNCDKLKEVQMSDSNVLSVGAYAFAECGSLSGLVYSTQLERIGDHCFDGSSVSSIAPAGFDCDTSSGVGYSMPRISKIGAAAFSNTAGLQCIAVPQSVPLDSRLLEGAQCLKHTMLLSALSSDAEAVIQHVLDTCMLGLSADCTFEMLDGAEVYKYFHGSDETKRVELLEDENTYFSLKMSELPEEPSSFYDMQSLPQPHVYKYSQTYIQYCMDNNIDFIVLCIDSKTSAKSKLFMMTSNASAMFSQNAPSAAVFVLDRHNADGSIAESDVVHYRKTLMDAVARRQMLVHAATDPHAVVDFPEASFIAKGGLKFQKMHLAELDGQAARQIAAAASNVFS